MRIGLIILVAVFLASCAAHAPMSETVIFSPKKINGERIEASHQMGFSFNTDLLDTKTLYPERKGYNDRLTIPNELSYFNTLYLKNEGNHFAAFSFSAGTGVGFDATARVIDPVYVTIGYSNVGQYELSLPVRLLHSEKIGWLAAPAYRNQIVYYDDLEEESHLFDFGPDGRDAYKTVGMKSSIYLFTPGINQRAKRLFYSAKLEGGKILNSKAWYFSFGLKIGGY
ncbi:MAG: hypothetical protein CL666_15380 [Balneola sp.]|nr:hypothetical protein [Balneola sp.]|tara:strand:- start:36736 stop:37413 length:678 start_codon:yes stop_codon:yes gene_type:complete